MKDECKQAWPYLDVLGTKWSVLIITKLEDGPKRFKQLHRDVAVVTTQSLTNALKRLVANGIVDRKVYPTVPVSVEYSLTEKGADLKRALTEIENWALRWQ
ncbi:winged helix-turn-helix transcriptional regulator [Gorillibacterium timonense]|uniref:winged helix-turn-helix transcriptional regulator n=1 Tax=Gorillibacterium timonense TaxID=1689269 RepID=UPI00071CB19F|nr:helix-turn-helix domain-containing protein [Gorillibacterium timonense]